MTAGLIALALALATALIGALAGLVYFARRAEINAREAGAASVLATRREGELQLADVKVGAANDAALTAEAARDKEQKRGDALEEELHDADANAAGDGPGDDALERMRGREVEVGD